MPRWKHLRWWKTAPEKAAEFAAGRWPQADDEFVAECGIPDSEDARNVALTVRRAVGEMLMLDPQFLRASDREAVELRTLWDSVDFLEWVLKTEEALNVRLPDKAFKALGRDYSVRDLVVCVYSGRAGVT
jgi:acyl carrier protein